MCSNLVSIDCVDKYLGFSDMINSISRDWPFLCNDYHKERLVWTILLANSLHVQMWGSYDQWPGSLGRDWNCPHGITQTESTYEGEYTLYKITWLSLISVIRSTWATLKIDFHFLYGPI
jgi:hypothetical protein